MPIARRSASATGAPASPGYSPPSRRIRRSTRPPRQLRHSPPTAPTWPKLACTSADGSRPTAKTKSPTRGAGASGSRSTTGSARRRRRWRPGRSRRRHRAACLRPDRRREARPAAATRARPRPPMSPRSRAARRRRRRRRDGAQCRRPTQRHARRRRTGAGVGGGHRGGPSSDRGCGRLCASTASPHIHRPGSAALAVRAGAMLAARVVRSWRSVAVASGNRASHGRHAAFTAPPPTP